MNLFRKRQKKEKTITAEATANPTGETPAEAARRRAIAAYQEKRTITVRRFFEITQLPFPESCADIADTVVAQITADADRTGPGVVFLCWDNPLYEKFKTDPIQRALHNGYLLLIADRPVDAPHTIYVPDEQHKILQEAYIRILHYIRSIHKAKVIGITGSIGKTSTKEMVEAVLRQHYRKPLISKGNNNSMFSVGRNIQQLKRPTNVYLQEVGAHSPGVITTSARQLECDMVLYTNISFPHLELYGSQENILKDKASLSDYGKADGLAFLNYDDPLLMAYPFRQRRITYSLDNPGAMYYAKEIQPSPDGFTFTIISQNLEAATTSDASASASDVYHAAAAQIHVLGEHNVRNAVAAYAIGCALRLPEEEILAGIADYRPSGMRQNLIHAAGYQIYADCYNSNLLSIASALSAMDQIVLAPGGRRIAVLGDILGLGETHEEIHRQAGQLCKAHQLDKLLGYGIDTRLLCEEAAKDGIDAKFFARREDLEAEIRRIRRPQDVILFKASHDVNLGATMDRLFGTDTNESTAIGHKQFTLTTEDGFVFYLFETSASIKTCLSAAAEITVPPFIEAEVTDELHHKTCRRQLPVEKIGKTAFRHNTTVQTVHLPDTVVRIRDGAFKDSSLVRFTAPSSLLSIGSEALADCPNLTEVILPPNVTDFGEDILADSPNAVVYCYHDTPAARWAEENGYPFSLLPRDASCD